MAVRWRDQMGTGFGKPYRTDFGRILVTIDDLTTLQDLLARYSVKQVRPAIQFDGGEFDAAEDLRMLPSVRELTMEVESKNIKVRLSEDAAYVVGAELVCLDLETKWAKGLQTNALTSKLHRELRRTAWRTLVPIGIVAFYLGVRISRFPDPWDIALAALTIIPAVYIVVSWTRSIRRARRSYAVIVPSTREEYRKSVAEHNRHLRQIIVAISASLVAAAVALGIAIFIGK